MSREWKKTKTIYWSDELNDDFDDIGLERPSIPKGYKYKRTNPINNFFSNILYYAIAIPLLGLFCRLKGMKIKGKKNLKQIKKTGAFVYSNHVSFLDVFKIATPVFFGRRVNIIGYSDASSLFFVKHVVRALGYLPLPLDGDVTNMMALTQAVKYYIKEKKQIVLIYPEAHIWPCYTKIRNFKDTSFGYPAMLNAPVVPITTTWRKSKIGKGAKQTLHIGNVIYPKPELSVEENRVYMHDECLRQMKEVASSVEQYEYIKYIKTEK